MPGVLTSAKLVADLLPAAHQWQRA
jgi:hypothetical protein